MQIYQQGQLGKDDCPRFTDYPPVPSPSMGREREGVKKLESGLSPNDGKAGEILPLYRHFWEYIRTLLRM